jgi:hypothetical protein
MPKSKIDPALVWLEIKSYIKGSLEALQLDSNERDDPMHRSDLSELVLILEGSKRETALCSDASNMWRVFTGYSKEDMETRHAKMEKEKSRLGHLSRYVGDHAWDDKLDLLQTCPLPFDEEKHKILENELKISNRIQRDAEKYLTFTV